MPGCVSRSVICATRRCARSRRGRPDGRISIHSQVETGPQGAIPLQIVHGQTLRQARPMTLSYPRDMIGYGVIPPEARWPGNARIALQFVINYEEGGDT